MGEEELPLVTAHPFTCPSSLSTPGVCVHKGRRASSTEPPLHSSTYSHQSACPSHSLPVMSSHHYHTYSTQDPTDRTKKWVEQQSTAEFYGRAPSLVSSCSTSNTAPSSSSSARTTQTLSRSSGQSVLAEMSAYQSRTRAQRTVAPPSTHSHSQSHGTVSISSVNALTADSYKRAPVHPTSPYEQGYYMKMVQQVRTSPLSHTNDDTYLG